MRVAIGKRAHRLSPTDLVGQGGEAEVFALGASEVVKVWKTPDHPDFAASGALREAARLRIAELQHKLARFPRSLHPAVVAPDQLALDPSTGVVIGFTMRRVAGADPLYALKAPRVRRTRGLANQTSVLLALYDAMAAIHQRDVVIGDFNDLNVLVVGGAIHLIDADSYQFANYRCSVYSERFVDPLFFRGSDVKIDFSPGSDRFAFAALAVQTLLSVEPYGGVLPSGSGGIVAAVQRPRDRLSIFNAPVRLPRPALPPTVLPDEVADYFARVFGQDHRGVLPRHLLDGLGWQICRHCGLEHARRSCPHCAPHAVSVGAAPAPLAAQRVTCPRRLAALATPIARDDVWLDGRRLMRAGLHGPVLVGDVLAGSTRFWVGENFGVGFYAAGRLRFGFVFDRARGGLNDRVRIPALTGTLAAADCALAENRAWLTITEQVGPALRSRLIVVTRRGETLAEQDVSGASFGSGLTGACAVGEVLLVPTDEGIVRLEAHGGAIAATKTFSTTRAVVDAATRLASDGKALYAINHDGVFELTC